jgi:hypothetical protein
MQEEKKEEQQQTAEKFATEQKVKKVKKEPKKEEDLPSLVLANDKKGKPKLSTPADDARVAKESKMKSKKTKPEAKKEKTKGRRSSLEGSITVKKKENPFREGSNRAIRLNIIFRSKSVEAALSAKEKGLSPSMKDLKRAVSKGLIKVG